MQLTISRDIFLKNMAILQIKSGNIMGPLQGLKIIELAGLGPAPFCGMLFADMGAEIISVERSSKLNEADLTDCSRRGKYSISLNLKNPEGVEIFLKLVEGADAVFEGFRPGVVEKLGVGPEDCLARNPKLIYGRMTGWGQSGPLSQAAGHDINYISLTGALHAIGRQNEKPVLPLNLVGDFGGGGMFLAFGMVCALLEAQKSGKGQVIDAAMTDGSALLMAMFNSLHAEGRWTTTRGSNLLDSGAHFYDVYETSDGKYISIGSLEPQFYELLIKHAMLDPVHFKDQLDVTKWPDHKNKLETVFKRKTRDEWCEIMEGTDVCFAPVLDFLEAQNHPHNVARETYIDVNNITQPAPAPRFSRTPPEVSFGGHTKGADTDFILSQLGLSPEKINDLRKSMVIL